MGGDDLGSDDDYLAAPIVAANNDDSDDDSSSSSSDDDNNKAESQQQNASKRKQKDNDVNGSRSVGNEVADAADALPTKKKRKREKNPLRELGVRIHEESNEIQAKLLTEFVATTAAPGVSFYPHNIAQTQSSSSSNFTSRMESIISKKQLKKWRVKGSPMVVIICLSARRAVQILKDLAPLRIRAVKLFAKHMSMEQQKELLKDNSFGFAVGTPHRILTLAKEEQQQQDNDDDVSLFEQTKLVVLDTCPNGKNFSVYTLPDTVPHTQALLKEFVHPECSRRKDMRVAFV